MRFLTLSVLVACAMGALLVSPLPLARADMDDYDQGEASSAVLSDSPLREAEASLDTDTPSEPFLGASPTTSSSSSSSSYSTQTEYHYDPSDPSHPWVVKTVETRNNGQPVETVTRQERPPHMDSPLAQQQEEFLREFMAHTSHSTDQDDSVPASAQAPVEEMADDPANILDIPEDSATRAIREDAPSDPATEQDNNNNNNNNVSNEPIAHEEGDHHDRDHTDAPSQEHVEDANPPSNPPTPTPSTPSLADRTEGDNNNNAAPSPSQDGPSAPSDSQQTPPPEERSMQEDRHLSLNVGHRHLRRQSPPAVSPSTSLTGARVRRNAPATPRRPSQRSPQTPDAPSTPSRSPGSGTVGRPTNVRCGSGAGPQSTVSFPGRTPNGGTRTFSVTIAASVANEFLEIMNEIFRSGFVIYDVGGFNCRPNTSNANAWSNHAYGLAVDINPDRNPYTNGRGKIVGSARYLNRAAVAGQPGVIGPDSAVVRAFKQRGWAWGGDYRSIKDYMHFEKNRRR